MNAEDKVVHGRDISVIGAQIIAAGFVRAEEIEETPSDLPVGYTVLCYPTFEVTDNMALVATTPNADNFPFSLVNGQLIYTI